MMLYRTRDDVLWHDAPLPPEDHECEPWTVADGPVSIDKCACGGWRNRKGSLPVSPWYDCNSRRRIMTPDVRYYSEDEWPWLTDSNRHLKTRPGIAYLRTMVEGQTNLAGVIIQAVGTEQARLNYNGPVEDALNERFMAECLETLRVADAVGAGHLIVRRGYRSIVTTRAHIVDGIALIITDLPETIDANGDGRCLP